MRAGLVVFAGALALSGCHHSKPTPQQQAAKDARDIAMVEKAQTAKPPPQSIDLQPIGPDQARKYAFQGSHCTFFRGDPGAAQAIVITLPNRAWIKVSGQMKTLASDPGAEAYPLGTWSKYDGKSETLRIEKAPGNALAPGGEGQRTPARVTVRDAYGQIIFIQSGAFACGQ